MGVALGGAAAREDVLDAREDILDARETDLIGKVSGGASGV